MRRPRATTREKPSQQGKKKKKTYPRDRRKSSGLGVLMSSPQPWMLTGPKPQGGQVREEKVLTSFPFHP